MRSFVLKDGPAPKDRAAEIHYVHQTQRPNTTAPLRILLINRFFWPDESSTSMLASDLAEDLASAGHEAHVLCARLLYDKPETPLAAEETWRGVRIHRLPSARLGRAHAWRRMIDLATFHASLHLLGPWKIKPDAVVVMTDPPMAISAGAWIARLRRAPLVHYVMDVYPDVAVALGSLRAESIAARALDALYSRWLRRCSRVIALGSRMAEAIARKGVGEEKIVIAPPWADGERIAPLPREGNRFRAELGLKDEDTLVVYSGNLGRAHGFDAILGGIEKLKGRADVHFVFIGGGARMADIERAAREMKLDRVRTLPYQPRERLGETLTAADAHLVSQDPRTVGCIVPSKLAGICAAGRPAVFIGDARSEIAEEIAREGFGSVVAEGDAAAFAQAIEKLADDPSQREEMGRRARATFEARYSRRAVTGALIAEIERLGAGDPAASASFASNTSAPSNISITSTPKP